STASGLAGVLTEEGRPLDVELSHPGDTIARMTPDDREWLADSGFRMLVPIIAASGSLIGLLAPGEKRSELPYKQADRFLLGTLASSAAAALGDRIPAVTDPNVLGDPNRVASECPKCGTLYAAGIDTCNLCLANTLSSPVPLVLGGKFR